MKTKKLVALVLVAVLAITSVVGGTLAYFQDTDSAKNVMTTGKVDIEQTEWERKEDGGFQKFAQDKLLVPGVYDKIDANWIVSYDDNNSLYIAEGKAWNGFWDDEEAKLKWNGSSDPVNTYNAQDKIVVVKNTGTLPAYYRTLIAVETVDIEAKREVPVRMNTNGNALFKWNLGATKDSPLFPDVDINGVKYDIFVATYQEELAAGELSRPSLLQIMFDKSVTNEEAAMFKERVDVLVLSQGVQTHGFATPEAALDEAFGGVTVEKVQEWFAAIA